MADAPSRYRGRAPLGIPGLSITFEVDGDILTVDGYGRPSHRRGVWGRLTPPAGYRGRAPLGASELCFFFPSVSAYRYVAYR